MTSNSVESINALTKTVRKIPITSLMDWFRQLLQDWYYERRQKYEDTQDDELTPWASAKIKYRYLKSSNWSVRGILKNELYQVRDNQGIHTVNLQKGECTCRRWQISGLPCGHVCAVARVEGLTSVNNLAKPWFLIKTIKATYAGLFFPVTDVSTWEIPNEIQQVLPPDMGKKQSGRPKNRDRIRSQGEGPIINKCGRCGVKGHNRTACTVPLPKLQNMVKKKQKSTQQAESSQGNNYRSETHQDVNQNFYEQSQMYEPQHVTNSTEDMYHPHQEYTHQYFMYQHNTESANMHINDLSQWLTPNNFLN
ncbi:transposase, MuDR, MULE transposase domain protein [Tanacetum coccineum]